MPWRTSCSRCDATLAAGSAVPTPRGHPYAPGAGIQVAIADDGVPKPFRGRSIPEAIVARGLSNVDGDDVLAHQERKAVRSRRGSVERVAAAPGLGDRETLRDAFRPGRFLGLLALLSFVERTSGRTLARDDLRASIVIDDPNLHRPRYGSLDFAAIARAARLTPLHVAMATIPLDAWYADRRAVDGLAARLQRSPYSSTATTTCRGSSGARCPTRRRSASLRKHSRA